MNEEADARTNLHALPTLEPRGELLIRYEPDTKKMYIAAGAFRKDCVENQTHYKDVLQKLEGKSVYLGAVNKRMSKGMKVNAPATRALMFDCGSADFINIDNLIAPELVHAD